MAHYNHKHQNNKERYFENLFNDVWIKKGIDSTGIKFTDDFGKYIKNNGLTTSQIRNIFGELKRIQAKGIINEKTKFLLLKPKIAYAVSRNGGKGLIQLSKVLNKAFDCMDMDNDALLLVQFQNFIDFFEAIIAYHKSYGGK